MQPMTPQQAQQQQAAKAAELVRWSRIGAALGFITMFGGCGAGIAARIPVLATIGIILGFGGLIAAAIVGQIGRAMQGRVI